MAYQQPYYHDIITQKSWEELKSLKSRLNFVLIGGWAVYLYTKALKSKDIDILLDYSELGKLRELYPSVYKNDRLSKYEAVSGDVQIDVYLPFYSNLGIPAEVLSQNKGIVDGFSVIDPNYLTVLKIFTYYQRRLSDKGRKDFVDLVSLFNSGSLAFGDLLAIVTKYNYKNNLRDFLKEFHSTSSVMELGINTHKMARLKKSIPITC